MAVHLEIAVSDLMKELISLSTLVEESVRLSVKALEKNDLTMAENVIKQDKRIDEDEIRIEEECLKIIALHQPVAIDLRRLVVILKINNDLERIGDLAANISKHVKRILRSGIKKENFIADKISEKVQKMLTMSIDSIINIDIEKSYEILATDDEVDEMNKKLYGEILEKIMEEPDNTKVLLQYIHIVRHLERIADHTTNIAEDIIYLIKGDIVRHKDL